MLKAPLGNLVPLDERLDHGRKDRFCRELQLPLRNNFFECLNQELAQINQKSHIAVPESDKFWRSTDNSALRHFVELDSKAELRVARSSV